VRLVVFTLCVLGGGLVLSQVAAMLIEQAASPAGTIGEDTARRMETLTNYILGVISGLLISTRSSK
jgi:hypothetical protein